jgi:hypothetical protein
VKAKKTITKDKVDQKIPLNIKELKDALDGLRGAIMIVYPAYHGLPEWEPVRMILENKYDFENVPQDVYEVIELMALTKNFSIITPKTLLCGGLERSF